MLQRILMLFILTLPLACKDGETIEDIGSYSITTKDFENHYSVLVEKVAQLRNGDKSTFARLMCHPERMPDDPYLREVVRNLEPKEFYERYREMRIIEQAARKENFQDDPIVKRMMEQAQLEVLTSLFVMKKLEKRIKISDEESAAKCVELRQKLPDQLGPLTLDECKKIAQGFIREERMRTEMPRVREEIKESVTISKNQKFDRDDFLANKLETYKVLKKTGGCDADSAGPALETPAKPK